MNSAGKNIIPPTLTPLPTLFCTTSTPVSATLPAQSAFSSTSSIQSGSPTEKDLFFGKTLRKGPDDETIKLISASLIARSVKRECALGAARYFATAEAARPARHPASADPVRIEVSPLFEEELNQFGRWCKRFRIVLWGDYDILLLATIMGVGESREITLTSLLKVLAINGFDDRLVRWTIRSQITALEKEGYLQVRIVNPWTSEWGIELKQQLKIRRILRRFKLQYPDKAEALGILGTETRVRRRESGPEPELTEIISRYETLLAAVERLTEHPDENIRRLVSRLKARIQSSDALQHPRLKELELQLEQLMRVVPARDKGVGVSSGAQQKVADSPLVAATEAEDDRVVTGDHLSVAFDEIDSLLANLRKQPAFSGNSELGAIEDKFLDWLGGAPVRQSELKETLKALHAMDYETRTEDETEQAEDAVIETIGTSGAQIDWSTFPRRLLWKQAVKILKMNGFLEEKNKATGHKQFTHPRLSIKVTIVTANEEYRAIATSKNVRKALEKLANLGKKARWK